MFGQVIYIRIVCVDGEREKEEFEGEEYVNYKIDLVVARAAFETTPVAVTAELFSRVPGAVHRATRTRAKFPSGCKHRVISFRETFALS